MRPPGSYGLPAKRRPYRPGEPMMTCAVPTNVCLPTRASRPDMQRTKRSPRLALPATHSHRSGRVNNFRLSRRRLGAWRQIQLTIMKFCICIRCLASSCARATRSFRQIRSSPVWCVRRQYGFWVSATHMAQTILPSLSCGAKHPHWVLRVSTRRSPRPLSASNPTVSGAEARSSGSHTWIRTWWPLDVSQSLTVGTPSACPGSCRWRTYSAEARTAFVTVSETSSSAFWWRSCLAVPGTRLAAGLGA